jgi:hypothetical protein
MTATLDIDIALSPACWVIQMSGSTTSTSGGCVKLRWADITIATVPGATALAAAHSSNLDTHPVPCAGLAFRFARHVAIRVSGESIRACSTVSACIES